MKWQHWAARRSQLEPKKCELSGPRTNPKSEIDRPHSRPISAEIRESGLIPEFPACDGARPYDSLLKSATCAGLVL